MSLGLPLRDGTLQGASVKLDIITMCVVKVMFGLGVLFGSRARIVLARIMTALEYAWQAVTASRTDKE